MSIVPGIPTQGIPLSERSLAPLNDPSPPTSASITGAQSSFGDAKLAYFNHINGMNLRNPRMIGFGISNKQTLTSAQDTAAGAIIGSKFVTLLNEPGDPDKALDGLFECLEK